MTFIQPNKSNSIFNKILVALIACLVIGVFSLIAIYNSYVNLSHGLSDMRGEFQTVQTENVALQKKIFNLLSSDNAKSLATDGSFVQDKNPAYLEIDPGISAPQVGEEAKLLSRFP
ncbi:MAG: hypothetical protein Q8P49_00330 [Candidatus Liptonbacteria bacterium]|nr:hypothetical protein [Candidatus Liptonbacteria bacterium]